MAVTFLEPGGDADFGIALWNLSGGTGTAVSDFVHGQHLRSIGYAVNSNNQVFSGGILSDTGSRISLFIYLNALPSATASIIAITTSGNGTVVKLRFTSGGILQLFENAVQIGSNGPTLSTGRWYRISLAYTVTSTTVNRFEVFVDGTPAISVTNATITNTGSDRFGVGNFSINATLDLRSSDHYVDNSSSLLDPGNIWVTAKRPNANGTVNNFNVQIGSGGSGYGSGHSPQVNERPLSTTNGWSVVAVGTTTEEYNIEAKSVGDINISRATIIDYMGWIDAKSLIAETGNIIVNNVSTAISITTSPTIFTQVAGSATYPAGTGTDIGMSTSATATTVSLYECGIVVAYIPANSGFLTFA